MKGSKVGPLQLPRKALQLPVQFSLNPYVHYDGKRPAPHGDLLGRNAPARVSLGCGVLYLLLEASCPSPVWCWTPLGSCWEGLVLGSSSDLEEPAGAGKFACALHKTCVTWYSVSSWWDVEGGKILLGVQWPPQFSFSDVAQRIKEGELHGKIFYIPFVTKEVSLLANELHYLLQL